MFARALRGLWVFQNATPRPQLLEAPAKAASLQAGCCKDPLLARKRLSNIFTPARPLLNQRFRLEGNQDGGGPFVGRAAEREIVLRALVEDRRHVLIYGERGLGKTSLANLTVAGIDSPEFRVIRHVCSADSDFDGIMRGLLRELSDLLGGPRLVGVEPISDTPFLLPSHPLRPGDILTILDSLAPLRRMRIACIVDEFDRVNKEDARTAMADLVKQCSDTRAPLSLIIIGASDDAEQLLGRHPSIQRCLARASRTYRPRLLHQHCPVQHKLR